MWASVGDAIHSSRASRSSSIRPAGSNDSNAVTPRKSSVLFLERRNQPLPASALLLFTYDPLQFFNWLIVVKDAFSKSSAQNSRRYPVNDRLETK
jgi:hypothetical protein